ncbi:MAG: hypothetical protein HZB38_18560 [Planctomycetes bacterium]|nr:hypothetical protein [Planctomycetota bacterium]
MNKYIGVGLHKKSIVVCMVNKEGQVLGRRTFACGEPALIAEWFAQQAPFEMVVEATASYEWFVRLVESQAERVRLAHPAKLRIFEQLSKRRGKKKAIVAVTRRLLCLMMSIVTNERPYQRAA